MGGHDPRLARVRRAGSRGPRGDRADRRSPEEATGLRALHLASAALLAAGLVLGCAVLPRTPAADLEPWRSWQSQLHRDDALVGRIYDTASGRFISPQEAIERSLRADFVLLGEKHDNPDHHRLQAWWIDSLVRAGRRPAVVFEMIPRDRAGALASALAAKPEDADAIGTALDWAASGWPDFALYRPVFASALFAHLPIVPGDLTRAQRASLRSGGLEGMPEAERQRLALDSPLPDAARQQLAEEVKDSHCGMATEEMIDAMVAVQRARDAELADAMIGAAGPGGVVLVAGSGHVRRDRGVPFYLARREPAQRVLALSIAEVSGGEAASDDLSERARQASTGFDLVWFTPRVDDDDPCERFRHELEKLRPPVAPPQARVP